MSKVLWKQVDNQQESARELLEELLDDVDIMEIDTVEGMTALAWGLRKIVPRVRHQIVEVLMDAMCK